VIEIALGVLFFTTIILLLVGLILVSRLWLVSSGEVLIEINQRRQIQAPVGVKLLEALSNAKLLLPSSCGGQGTCGQCRIKVDSGGGEILPTELNHISKREARNGERLACQVTVKGELSIEIPEEIFGIQQIRCRVKSNQNVSTFIKELVLSLPSDQHIAFRAGGYVMLESPPHDIYFRDFDIPEQYRQDWEELGLLRYESKSKVSLRRAYSLANFPLEDTIIILNVRIATPPPNAPDAPPGIVSSYIHSLKPGDDVTISGPYGEFFARQSDAEMIFVGGGAGMAPMRSHIFDQLKRIKSQRKISFWYGARSKSELFYVDQFDALAKEYDNFDWYVAISQPKESDHWTGYTGNIHQVLYDAYLREHEAPEECEYYLCGPPIMAASVIKMLEDLGVEKENIFFDDFGG